MALRGRKIENFDDVSLAALSLCTFLGTIQKRALSRSVQLEAVYLKALLYCVWFDFYCIRH